jgi:hypothetical protein
MHLWQDPVEEDVVKPENDMRFQYDVFLSHNAKDKPRVRRLAERLREAGLRVWFDEWVIKPGDDIYLAVERGLEAARSLVLCLSPAAFGSDWVALERSTVLFRDPSNAGRRFIPLLLADCKLPDTLRRYKYVDYRDEADAVFHELLLTCKRRDEVTIAAQLAENPKTVVLTTKTTAPQWADHLELNLGGKRLELLTCKVLTESAYFRCGFKLLNLDGRLFGDGSIQSQDANLVVHIGRNNWDRRQARITAKNVFFTSYLNGIPFEDDKRLFSSGRRLAACLELKIDSSYVAAFSVNGVCCLSRVVPPGICRRVAMLAWGDRERYQVEVSDLAVTTAPGL